MHSDNKRRHARASIRGVARLDGAVDLVSVRDLSAGGLGLVGGATRSIGAPIELEMRILGEAVVARGRVAWATEGPHPQMGVLFDGSAELAALVDALEQRLSGRRARGSALLVEAEPSRAALLAEYLWSHGYDVEEVPAPLHAIERLARGDVRMVAIGPRLSTCSGDEFARFVAENFPRVHRLVVAHIAHGTGTHTVAAAFEVESVGSSIRAVVCDELGGGKGGKGGKGS
jgi:hypothetical protein